MPGEEGGSTDEMWDQRQDAIQRHGNRHDTEENREEDKRLPGHKGTAGKKGEPG